MIYSVKSKPAKTHFLALALTADAIEGGRQGPARSRQALRSNVSHEIQHSTGWSGSHLSDGGSRRSRL
jgi:hypothetical protein